MILDQLQLTILQVMQNTEHVSNDRADVQSILKMLQVEKPPSLINQLKERLNTLGVRGTVSMTRKEAREAWKNEKFELQNQVTFILRVHTYQHARIHWRVDCNILL
jgi:hypothetical protein